MEIFERGDIVRLKSGGPDMVVYDHVLPTKPSLMGFSIPRAYGVYVEWIDSIGAPHTEIYVPEVLIKQK